MDRITMMPVISASEDTFRPLFVVRGKYLRYRVVKRHGRDFTETLSDFLPRGNVMCAREKVAVVESDNFLSWAQIFCKDVQELTRNGRKVLLIIDGYRSHMPFTVMHTLEQKGVIVYALPSYTRGITQPLDVGVFVPFKEHMHKAVKDLSSPESSNEYDSFDYLKLMTEAYHRCFTRSTTMGALTKACVWPLNPGMLFNVRRPVFSDNTKQSFC